MFQDEMQAQPDALLSVVRHYCSDEGKAALHRAGELARTSRAVTFMGMGSSLYAAYAVLPKLWSSGWRAVPMEAGETLHYALPGWTPDGLLVAVSQSGESAETRAVAEALKDAPIIAVTNDVNSGLARAAGAVLPMLAGEEAAISTKTYTNTLAVLHLLAAALVEGETEAVLADLVASADGMRSALRPDLDDAISQAAQVIDEAKSLHYIGRGPSLAATYGGALIMGEGAHVTAVGLPGASFRHGPMELAGEGHAALLFMPDGKPRPLLEKLRGDLDRVGTKTITFTDAPSANTPTGLEIVLGAVPNEAYFPLVAAIGVERILAGTAQRRGITPGDFRYGGKVTSEE